MLELISVLATVAGAVIAYVTFQHHKKESSQRNTEAAENSSSQTRATHGPSAIGSVKEQMDPGVIPDGIVFGKKVVLVPGPQDLLFSHSGRFQNRLENLKSYSWLQRDDIIGRYHMNVPNSNAEYFRHFLGSEDLSVEVRSPVSGLLLFPSLFMSSLSMLGSWPKQEDVTDNNPSVSFAVLVADDEPPPETCEKIYSPAIRFIRDHRGPFFRESRYWTRPAMTEEQFECLIDMQLSADCLFIDAMPKFEKYFEEARTRYPHLRPHIKHLL